MDCHLEVTCDRAVSAEGSQAEAAVVELDLRPGDSGASSVQRPPVVMLPAAAEEGNLAAVVDLDLQPGDSGASSVQRLPVLILPAAAGEGDAPTFDFIDDEVDEGSDQADSVKNQPADEASDGGNAAVTEDVNLGSTISVPAQDTSLRSCFHQPRLNRRRSLTPPRDTTATSASGRRLSLEESPTQPSPLAQKVALKEVSFNEPLVTANLEDDPLRLMGTRGVTEAYVSACRRLEVEPLSGVLAQLKDTESESESVFESNSMRVVEREQLRGECLCLRDGSGKTKRLSLSDIDALEEVFRRRQWHRVDATDCRLNSDTTTALLQLVSYYDAASWLSLAGARPGHAGWQVACKLVSVAGDLSSLQCLSLERCVVEEPAAAALGKSLRVSGLRVLHLERCCLHGRPLSLLATGLRYCTGLRQLFLADNALCAGDGSLLGNAVRFNTTLQLLDVRNNRLDDDAAGYLISGIAEQNPSPPDATGLLSLNLWNNHLTVVSAKPLVELLIRHPTLETLNLGRNALTDGAVKKFTPALIRNDLPLRRLGLQSCGLTLRSAALIKKVLVSDPPLRRLDLRGNALGETGVRGLADGLSRNDTLWQLDVDMPGAEGNGSRQQQQLGDDAEFEGSDDYGEASAVGSRANGRSNAPALLSPPGESGRGDSPDSRLGTSPAVRERSLSTGSGGNVDVTEALAAIATRCEANRQRPRLNAPAALAPPLAGAPEEATPAPHGPNWLKRRLSAALRRVSLTCEIPPTPLSVVTTPQLGTATKPLDVPGRSRRMVSPGPSPTASPLPSPSSEGGSRFRMFPVASVAEETTPGTPPLKHGLLRRATTLPASTSPPDTSTSTWSQSLDLVTPTINLLSSSPVSGSPDTHDLEPSNPTPSSSVEPTNPLEMLCLDRSSPPEETQTLNPSSPPDTNIVEQSSPTEEPSINPSSPPDEPIFSLDIPDESSQQCLRGRTGLQSRWAAAAAAIARSSSPVTPVPDSPSKTSTSTSAPPARKSTSMMTKSRWLTAAAAATGRVSAPRSFRVTNVHDKLSLSVESRWMALVAAATKNMPRAGSASRSFQVTTLKEQPT